MEHKKCYLLEAAHSFEMEDISSAYIYAQNLNMVTRGSRTIPLVTEEGIGKTESKTMQAPGDDDPDLEDEGCY